MKRIALLSIMMLIVLLVTACGGSAPSATQAPATQPPVNPPASTEVPPAQPVSTQVDPAADNGAQVDITLADNTIEASQTTFQVGIPYTFVIKNAGRHAHNFNISTPVSVAGSLDAALSSALLAVDRDKLPVGASVTVEYTFPDSAAGAQLEFSCLIKRHYEDKMYLPITVTK